MRKRRVARGKVGLLRSLFSSGWERFEHVGVQREGDSRKEEVKDWRYSVVWRGVFCISGQGSLLNLKRNIDLSGFVGLAVSEVYLHEFIFVENGAARRKLSAGMLGVAWDNGRGNSRQWRGWCESCWLLPSLALLERGATKISQTVWFWRGSVIPVRFRHDKCWTEGLFPLQCCSLENSRSKKQDSR